MLRRLPVLTVAVLLSAMGAVGAAPSPMGSWARSDGTVRMTMAPCGSQICAVNTWIKDPAGGEAVGDRLEMTLHPGDGGVLTGEAYDRKRDTTYAMKLTVDATSMTTRGCIMAGLLCKSTAWSRIP